MSGWVLERGSIRHYFLPLLYLKKMQLAKGHRARTHAHLYDHVSVLAAGRVRITVDEEETEYAAPAYVRIAAGKPHRIVALEDATWYCVHATEVVDPARIDETLIEEAADALG